MAVLTVLAGLAFFTPVAMQASLVLMALLVVASVAEGWSLRLALKRIQVERILPPIVARGRMFSVKLNIVNVGGGDYRGIVRDVVPPGALQQLQIYPSEIGPGETLLSYPLTIPERGSHTFGNSWLRIKGKLGLVELQKSCATGSVIRVLPESLVPDEELSKDALDERQLMDQISESRNRGDGTEFESLSEYREGDDVRRINWRSTARLNRLIVCRYQMEQHRDVVVLVDCGRLMGTQVENGTKLDCAVNAALVIARVALQTGDRCGLGIFDSKVRGFLSPIAGAASHRILIDHLYNVKPGWVETNFAPMFATLQSRQRKRALLVILSDMMEAETTERYRAALMSLRGRHEIVFAALRTPLLTQAALEPIDDSQDVARKTFALRLMREREQTLHTLKRSGIHVLDVEPKQLTIPLLNSFIEIKQRSAG